MFVLRPMRRLCNGPYQQTRNIAPKDDLVAMVALALVSLNIQKAVIHLQEMYDLVFSLQQRGLQIFACNKQSVSKRPPSLSLQNLIEDVK